MFQRHHHTQRIVTKGQGLQVAGVHCVGDDADIRRAVAQGMQNAQAWLFLQVDVDMRVADQKAGEQFGQVFAQG